MNQKGNNVAMKDSGFLDKVLSKIEKAGNKLPDPVTLFIILSAAVVIISAICSTAGISAVHPGTGKTITVVNLLSQDGIRMMLNKAVTNFSGFAPLGMVLVAVIGSGAAEKSGFLAVLMHKVLASAPPAVVTFAILFVGINGNIAGDSAFVIMPPLAAIVFLSMGRHPLLGMFVAYAGVAAGFCANIALGLSDALAYGYTEAAAKIIDPTYATSPAINYYFLVVSCIILSLAGTFVTEKFMAPRFAGEDISKYAFDSDSVNLTAQQKKGLKAAVLSLFVAILAVVFFCLGDNPLLGDPKTHSLLAATSPLMGGIVLLVSILLFIPGAVYGFVSGEYKNDKELFASVTEAFRDMAPYILLCFFCAQFTSYFAWSNLGLVLAVKGAEFLKAMNFTGTPLLVGLIIVSCIINMFIGSASAKWAILAPVFVPMMMLLNYDPAVSQVAYRIGDSITNPLSPLFYYFPLILGFARRYEKGIGMGTIIANMIPFSFTFAICWIVQLVVWTIFNLPLGPGGNIFLK